VLVDDSSHFREAASRLLASSGLTVAGVAATSAEALAQARELEPDVMIVDVGLSGESGFDLAWQLAAEGTPNTVLTSTRSESDFAELVAVTPALGFISKNELSGDAVRDFVGDRNHGHGCRHEALVYSSPDELAAGAVPFIRHGLAAGEHVLAVLKEPAWLALEQALGHEAAGVALADADEWYRSPEHAFESYTRYVHERLALGASRIRIVAEVVWPRNPAPGEFAAWKRYEAGISEALAAVAVSFICAYNTRELDEQTVMDARRTHPIMRTAEGARPSARYVPPGIFVRELERR
jgi:two-component system nitrate/nitrite response regulator NarL